MILIVSNTILGKRGNIGNRISKIITEEAMASHEFVVVARGATNSLKGYKNIKEVYTSNMLCFLQRALNGIRKYLISSFNSRFYDIFIFNCLFTFVYFTRLRGKKFETVLLTETSLYIVKLLKRAGHKVVLDVPIAPQEHIHRLKREFPIGRELRYFNWLAMQEKQCFRESSHVIVPSEYIRAIVVKYTDNVTTIPFGVTPSYSFAGSRKVKEKIVIGFLGNVSVRKGADKLIHAVLQQAKGGKFKLIIQGKKQVRIKYNEKSEYLDVRPFGNINEFFNDIDCLVLPTLMEGSAKVIYEALARGVRVFTTEYAGPPFVDGKGIIMIDSNNIDLEKIEKTLRQQHSNRLDNDYVNCFVWNYSWAKYAENVMQVLQRKIK